MPGCDEPIAAIVAGPAGDEDAGPGAKRVQSEERLGDGKAGQFHELVDREGAAGHEVLVECCGGFGGEGLQWLERGRVMLWGLSFASAYSKCHCELLFRRIGE